MSKAFEAQLARQQRLGRTARLEKAPPIGTLPSGKLNVVKPGAPPQQPIIVPAETDGVLGDLDDYDNL